MDKFDPIMSDPAMSETRIAVVETPPSSRTFAGLLLETARLYRRHWAPFTRRLLLPMLWIYLGAYTCLAGTFRAVAWMTGQDPLFMANQTWLALAIVGAICAVTLTCFCRGFWQYMVYWASLNINASEVIEGRKPDFEAAYQTVAAKARPYSILLITYCLLPLTAIIPVIACNLIGARLALHTQVLLSLAGLLLGGGIGLLWLVGMIFLSLMFQVVAFEPLPDNPIPTFLRSARLVWPRFWQATGLQVILYMVTGYVVPWPIWGVIWLLHIAEPLNMLHRWMTEKYLEWAVMPPEMALLAGWIQQDIPGFAVQVTGMVVMMAIVSLLLPMGTFAFTLLYRETAGIPKPSS